MEYIINDVIDGWKLENEKLILFNLTAQKNQENFSILFQNSSDVYQNISKIKLMENSWEILEKVLNELKKYVKKNLNTGFPYKILCWWSVTMNN